MTIRFAAARNRAGPLFSFSKRDMARPLAANNDRIEAANDDAVLTHALRHFAEHGICAARRAGDEALTAHAQGDRAGFDWWLSVCRMLDRRMADAVATRTSLAV